VREIAPPVPADDPSFIALHPGGGTLYAVHELGRTRGENWGAVSSFSIDRDTGELAPRNRQPTGGAAPCHVRVTADGRILFVANYWGGSFSAFPLAPDGGIGACVTVVQHRDGAIGPGRDPGPHVHWTSPDPGGRHLFVADLGRDEILCYRLDPDGLPIADAPGVHHFPAGTGPRHAVFLAGGRWLAVASELASTITILGCDPNTCDIRQGQSLSTLPEGATGENAVAEIAATPDEKFLYVSNRGHDSIAIFEFDPSAGSIAYLGFCHTDGVWPRHFAIDPSGRVLVVANQRSDALEVFHLDPDSGALRATRSTYAVPAPTCVAIGPTMSSY